MNLAKTHKDLLVWKKGITLVKTIYQITAGFPRREDFCITNQLRRAAISIPSNLAEGAARNSTKEFGQFIHIALGSVSEIDTQILICKELGYITDESYLLVLDELDEISKMLTGLLKALQSKS